MMTLRKMKNESEVFRHLRPNWFDRNAFELKPRSKGGISFLLVPTEQTKVYNFWLYMCPMDAVFSAKQAVKTLRDVYRNNVVPWGTITLSHKPILDELVSTLILNKQYVPKSPAIEMIENIVMQNAINSLVIEGKMQSATNAKEQYAEN